MKASENLGVKILPTNKEIAIELDRIAQEIEGPKRTERLILMRKEALRIMNVLRKFNPLLLGSVWRGNVHRNSDIDIETYHDKPEEIIQTLENNNIPVLRNERMTITKNGKLESSYHITVNSSGKQNVEIIIRPLEELGRIRKCEVFMDDIRGVNIEGLERVLKENPAESFLPK